MPRRSRANSSSACERRPGSSTKLASIESYTTPRSSTPARRSTSQSNFTLCPALETAGSSSNARSGRSASCSSGGRFTGGGPASSSPSGGRCANGRYHARPGATASDNPTSRARIASIEVVSASSATSGAARQAATTSASTRGSVTITASVPSSAGGGAGTAEEGAEGAEGGGGGGGGAGRASLSTNDRNSS